MDQQADYLNPIGPRHYAATPATKPPPGPITNSETQETTP
jgi:hypothetical protein